MCVLYLSIYLLLTAFFNFFRFQPSILEDLLMPEKTTGNVDHDWPYNEDLVKELDDVSCFGWRITHF